MEFGDIVVFTTPWTITAEALRLAGKVRSKKCDCTNALKPDMSGLLIGTTSSAGEEVARLAPWATVVKAIPPFAELLHSANTLINGVQRSLCVGMNADARKVVAGLVVDIGAEPVDAGPLYLARYTEPACMLLVQLGYVQGWGTRIGLAMARAKHVGIQHRLERENPSGSRRDGLSPTAARRPVPYFCRNSLLQHCDLAGVI